MKTTHATFVEVKAAVPIAAVINYYLEKSDLEPVDPSLVKIRIPCFICDYEDKNSFSANADKNVYQCFHCGSAGNIINLVMDAEQLKDWEACRLIAERHDVEHQGRARPEKETKAAATTPAETETPTEVPEPVVNGVAEEESSITSNTPLRFELKNIDLVHESRNLLELAPETLDHFGVGFYSGRGHFKDNLIMPIRNIAGTLIGYCSLNASNEIVGYPPEKNFNRGYDLFNAGAVLELDKPGVVLAITKSPLKVMQLYNEGARDVLSFFGESLTATQINLLIIIITKNQYTKVVFYGSGESDEEVGRIVRALDIAYVNWID